MGIKGLTRKQREVQAREEQILQVARRMLLDGGYHGLTMARVAEAMEYSKATIYQHFACKEDIIVALATRSNELQRELNERANAFQGRTRERMVAIGVSTDIFAQLYPNDARIFQTMNSEAIVEKASDFLLNRLRASALRTVEIIYEIVADALAQGDVQLEGRTRMEDFVYHLWVLGEGGKAAAMSWFPPSEMGVTDPFRSIIDSCHRLGDGYGWRPLSHEWDYEHTFRRVLEEVFPKEAARLYGVTPGALSLQRLA